ncbi:MAG TPA: DNA polymerase III subunit delta [Methylophilus sp.]|nr:DNA polymerase III subunit delta [Methylophilus sp.]HQQ32597.1 DNA polymerase III subunit delta [Methylophilus sp.]
MHIDSAQLTQHLSTNLASIYVLLGEEPLAQTECLDNIRSAARKAGADERNSYTVERNFNWQQIQQFGQATSLFSSRRILEISIPSGKPGVEGSKALIELAQAPFPDVTTIVLLPNLDRDAKNSVWWSALQNAATVVDLKEISTEHLPQWISRRLAMQQQSADPASLSFMAQQVEGNLLAAHQEIQKLGLLYPAGKLSHEDIIACVLNVSRFDAFQLGESVLLGDTSRTARILQGLRDEGEQPLAVMNPLLWQFRPLIELKHTEARGGNMTQAMTNARIYGERQTLVRKALARFSIRQLEATLQKLCDIDKMAKGVQEGDAWQELSRLCFGLAKIRARS